MEAFAELFTNAPELSRHAAETVQPHSVHDVLAPFPQEPHKTADRVLLVGDGAELERQLRDRLLPRHWELEVAPTGAAGLACLRERDFVTALVASALPDLEVGEFKQLVTSRFPGVEVLDLESCRSASPGKSVSFQSSMIAEGTSIVSPTAAVRPSDLTCASSIRPNQWEGMVGASASMQRVFRTASLVATRDTTVLISGESGTGKDLLAQAIHSRSQRARQPFIVINCAAIPEALLEAELFGYTKGSFTGASQSRHGRVHAAHGGTLFLDEIGDMPLPLQSKILRFLEQGEVQRIGSTDALKVDCRVIAATNVRLQEQITAKQFREDLYYRLAVLPIAVPPLRDRLDDLPALCASFLSRFCPGTTLHPGALDVLLEHRWPGNIRELRNVMERATVVAEGRTTILAEDLLL